MTDIETVLYTWLDVPNNFNFLISNERGLYVFTYEARVHSYVITLVLLAQSTWRAPCPGFQR